VLSTYKRVPRVCFRRAKGSATFAAVSGKLERSGKNGRAYCPRPSAATTQLHFANFCGRERLCKKIGTSGAEGNRRGESPGLSAARQSKHHACRQSVRAARLLWSRMFVPKRILNALSRRTHHCSGVFMFIFAVPSHDSCPRLAETTLVPAPVPAQSDWGFASTPVHSSCNNQIWTSSLFACVERVFG
jgi:hypothetical protein